MDGCSVVDAEATRIKLAQRRRLRQTSPTHAAPLHAADGQAVPAQPPPGGRSTLPRRFQGVSTTATECEAGQHGDDHAVHRGLHGVLHRGGEEVEGAVDARRGKRGDDAVEASVLP